MSSAVQIKPLPDLLTHYKSDKGKWILIGKGPSYRDITEQEEMDYGVMTINHTIKYITADIASVIDWDVIDSCAEAIYANAKVLAMPYYPHIGFSPNPQITLEEWSCQHPVLRKMREEGRLYGYNLSTARVQYTSSPKVKAQYFTSEASLDILGYIGATEVATIGIDGGKERSTVFSELANVNQERGYDAQWAGIRAAFKRHSINYHPIELSSPIRIFVGAGEAQLIPALVLKHSIEKYATMSVEVTPMIGWRHSLPKDPKNCPRTPFSFQRFMIPQMCNYKGYAIYMDSDMLVFDDVKEIWRAKMVGEVLTMLQDDVDKHRAKYSVMKLNCNRLDWYIEDIIKGMDGGALTYDQVVFELLGGTDIIIDGHDPEWNSLEVYKEGQTKLLHYTEMYNQPWLVNPNHPLGHLWFNELREANRDGSIPTSLIQQEVHNGHILPKCLEVISA